MLETEITEIYPPCSEAEIEKVIGLLHWYESCSEMSKEWKISVFTDVHAPWGE